MKNEKNQSFYILCLSVRVFVSYKRQNGLTDRDQVLCGTSRDPREGVYG